MKKSVIALAMAVCLAHPSWASDVTIAAVSINGSHKSDVEELRVREDGQLLISIDRWTQWGVQVPASLADRDAVSPSDLNADVQFDPATQSYSINVPAKYLPARNYNQASRLRTNVGPSPKGVMLGYDYRAQDSESYGFTQSLSYDVRTNVLGGALFGAGQFNKDSTGLIHERSLTTWSRDLYASQTRVQIGDVINATPNGSLLGSRNLLGVRVGTDRSLSDDAFYPVPTFNGVADTRSTAEVFVNSVRASQQQFQPGPYQFANLNSPIGLSTVSMVVRDELGREYWTTRQFYSTPKALAKGRSEWEVSGGLMRNGGLGNNYADLAANAVYARGMSDRWTTTAAFQATATGRTAMWGNLWTFGRWGAATFDIATSGDGMAATIGYERRTNGVSWSASHTHVTDDYWNLNRERSRFALESQTTLGVAYRQNSFSAALNYSDVRYSNRSTQLLTAQSRWQLNSRSELSVFAQRDLSLRDTTLNLGFRYQFGSSASTSVNLNDGEWFGQANGSTTLKNRRLSWNASASANNHYVAGRWDLPMSTLLLQNSTTNTVFGANGGVWIGEGGVLPTSRPFGSYALIRVPNLPNTHVQLTGKSVTTNALGVAVVPNVSALFDQTVTVDALSLPFGVQLDSLSKKIVAPRGGGTKLQFDVVSNTTREYVVVQNGVPIDMANVKGKETVIGVRGALVLEAPIPGDVLTVEKDGSTCAITIPHSGELDKPILECKEVL
ncbi:fimbrial biogenesis outer membrane usher protein [Stenotrophomonas maltophilia]|uniref:Fimbrial biogenesis outer membrane usher protein n=1 Tax=Stenotrophomonas maltophilia TaxID=40324 RepID=A0AAI9FXS3_STEMA|nr:fimbria/pilus outer membrane usher protein [Stenotrophomonas maltophilia]EKT4439488.1 fimbrial biogenesis outer membrane usher protein [Stenotrophomonas maltophilia]MBH1561259.1 fimbrial biogenesis outer membrane usher protein [Stenotrophomonas maltophilia]